ncbi:MAG: DUF4835 family protein [Saprospiraceae bacterium]|nr:DUF4835 family protein [Saprospiraceae bacterium]
MKNWFLLFIAVLFAASTQAQELRVKVTMNTPKLQTADPALFQTLRQSIEEFMNNQKWTSDAFEEDERIKMNIVITISKELSSNTFEAELSCQSIRPVYNSNYETALFKHQDKDVTFSYEPFQALDYSQTSYLNNLTSILAYYANIAIGMDYDSFSPFGGEPYYQAAWDIVNRIPPNVAASVKGWVSTENNRNRYWLIENLLHPKMRPFRQMIYDYHRQGMDTMYDDPNVARAIMAQGLEALEGVNRTYPNSMIVQVFANTKSDEIIEIFKGGATTEKSTITRVMERVDPTRASEYRQGIGK